MRRRIKTPKEPSPPSKLSNKYQQQPPRQAPFAVKPRIAFFVLFASHVAAAFFQPIQDCDEVFNYWEPTHYLMHRHGFQTWEYSPEYAIRSWAYVALHALVMLPVKAIGGSKIMEFYALRSFFAFICALCEARLFTTISATLNPRIAITFLGLMVTSPGMVHASISYLPSSFAMYFVMLGMSAFMDWRGGLRTAQGIWMFGVAATLGWPFAVALAIPYLLEELFLGWLGDKEVRIQLFWRLVDGAIRSCLVLIVQFAVDCFFYKKIAFVPLNIVLYNVFSSKGPDLYGTEPWHFYVRNLFLNFHVWFILALLSIPLLVFQHSTRSKGAMRTSWLRGIVFLSPFYLWLGIFTFQPHKEERFMYPAYPALALNAAVALHIILANFGSTDPKDIISKVSVQLRLICVLGFVLASLLFSIFRVVGNITAYQAPLAIYQPLHRPHGSKMGDQVCLGKEWYRFPSHYLVPDGVRAKFVKSEFSGLLPGEFSEAQQGFGLFPGTWLVPPGMNDENREDIGKYTNVKHCTFLVDSLLPSTETTELEPKYISDESHWTRVKCLPFLDSASTGIIGRLGWVPDLPFLPKHVKRVWGEYCMLKRKKKLLPEQRIDGVPNIETLQ
ncbi:glycosyltransferase family 22 protein [Acidomyces richmondensis BFW]|nr:MAG: glycosyltransferase family 22 protein [Acidomyces sp. 'richmondensis']KYG44826.1 glycosyltransferase family 22 protein [Acidomyces richmondensis BFW]